MEGSRTHQRPYMKYFSSGFGNVKEIYKSSTFATKPLGTGLPSNDASFKQRLTEEVIYNIEERVICLSLT
jgi:hypothetical protein